MGILTVNITVSLGKLLTSYTPGSTFFLDVALFLVWDGYDRSSFFRGLWTSTLATALQLRRKIADQRWLCQSNCWANVIIPSMNPVGRILFLENLALWISILNFKLSSWEIFHDMIHNRCLSQWTPPPKISGTHFFLAGNSRDLSDTPYTRLYMFSHQSLTSWYEESWTWVPNRFQANKFQTYQWSWTSWH